MSADLKALLKQLGEDHRNEQAQKETAEIERLLGQGMTFQEAWDTVISPERRLGEEVPRE